jgi:hypothetical protein
VQTGVDRIAVELMALLVLLMLLTPSRLLSRLKTCVASQTHKLASSSTMFENVRSKEKKKFNFFFILLIYLLFLETHCGGLPWPFVWSLGIRCGKRVALGPKDRNANAKNIPVNVLKRIASFFRSWFAPRRSFAVARVRKKKNHFFVLERFFRLTGFVVAFQFLFQFTATSVSLSIILSRDLSLSAALSLWRREFFFFFFFSRLRHVGLGVEDDWPEQMSKFLIDLQ